MMGCFEKSHTQARRILAGVLLLALTLGGAAYGQEDEGKNKSVLYQWTDGKGVVHITDNPAKVPKKYRSSTIQLESTEGQGEQQTQQPGTSPQESVTVPEAQPQQESVEDFKKSMWQSRMREARDRLADLEARYKNLEKQRDEALRSWGGPASGMMEGRAEADRIEKDMQQVKKEVDAARNEVENVIPDEARKAGVPPGWLRE